ncbi:MAG TPA: hypothetical protein VJ924_10985, partial [Alphaproteobacteria bacterium]|nr:hypothetical protein [Alphaproteobacteria bacterium]
MPGRAAKTVDTLASSLAAPPSNPLAAPDATTILFGTREPPPFKEGNIFPLEWRVETPKLAQIYDASRDPGWAPNKLPWNTLDVDAF